MILSGDDAISAELRSWAADELAPWHVQRLQRLAVERQIHALATQVPSVRLFVFDAGEVTLLPPATGASERDAKQARADLYLGFFRAVAKRLDAGFAATIAVCPTDRRLDLHELPVFRFQKTLGDCAPLLPDIDFLLNDFYGDAAFRDTILYPAKAIRAVFAGATTGGRIDVPAALDCRLPRLRAARYFAGSTQVDFRLPAIVQCVDDTARAVLEAQPFTQRGRLSWQEQFGHRFILSLDGNGATCSRIAVALASNSVLLKYQSAQVLFYFRALRPHVHYVPIVEDAGVLDVLASEARTPGCYLPVAQAATAFAARFLSRAQLEAYTAHLLGAYAALMT